MTRSQETAKKKLCTRFEMPHNASKQVKTFQHCSVVRSSTLFPSKFDLELFGNTGENSHWVGIGLANTLSVASDTDCHHPKCCSCLGTMRISYETHWHIISPKDCTWGNCAIGEEWEQIQFWRYCFFVQQRVHRFQGCCFMPHPQYWKHKRQDTLIEVSLSAISICPHTTRSTLTNLTWQIDTTWQMQSIGNLHWMIFLFIPNVISIL